MDAEASTAVFREVSPARGDEWAALGHPRRTFFPHRIRHLPKAGPDAFRLAAWMCGLTDPLEHWEIVLHAGEPLLSELPPSLFSDTDLYWHGQDLGLPGHVASVNVVVHGRSLYSSAHLSDLVQRIGRRREHKTLIEKRLQGWDRMLLNALLDFALERGVRHVHVPTARLALEHTDQERNVGPELFDRVYDQHVREQVPTTRSGDWWRIDVRAAAGRVVRSVRREEPLAGDRMICVCHDIERGLGHLAADPEWAARAERTSEASLAGMLAAEGEAGVSATYNVVGILLGEVRGAIDAGGHCLAFHSYDHDTDVGEGPRERALNGPARRRIPPALSREELTRRARSRLRRVRADASYSPETPQLDRCRGLDYRLKGYRPPQSLLTPELSDSNLLFHNFEWLASSDISFGFAEPAMAGRLVRLPVLMDDFDLYRGTPYDDWEAGVMAVVSDTASFAAVALHDCYGELWVPRYARLLERLAGLGRLTTMDVAAARVTLAHAE